MPDKHKPNNFFEDFDDGDQEQRREQRKKREEEKRRREQQRAFAETLEALEDDVQEGRPRAKRKPADLKKLAKDLNLKQLVDDVIQISSLSCWGPEVATEKNVVCMGIYLNYLDGQNGDADTQVETNIMHHFGIWLYEVGNRLQISIGTKSHDRDDAWDPARPPAKEHILLTLGYHPDRHEQLQQQINAALQGWAQPN